MANLEQVLQQLASLQVQTQQGLQQLHQAYAHYLQTLAPIAEQQLITAAYNVCTQILPERFLKLPAPEREMLLAQIQQTGLELRQNLAGLLNSSPNQPPPDGAAIPSIPDGLSDSNSEKSLDNPPLDEAQSSAPLETDSTPKTSVSRLAPKSSSLVHIDATTAQLLHQAAYTINRLLQRVEILPDFPWEQILEIVLKAEGRPLSRVPNVMMVMVAGPGTRFDPDNSPNDANSTPKKSNHNPPSLSPSPDKDAGSSNTDTTQDDSDPRDEQDRRDIAALFQALMKRHASELEQELTQDGRSEQEESPETDGSDDGFAEVDESSQDYEPATADDDYEDVPTAEDRPLALIALYLQLEDLDFNHPGLGSQRQQIRQLKANLSQLQQKMDELFRQRLVLEASRAWRETWPMVPPAEPS